MELLKRISAYTLISVITGAISFLLLPVLTKYLSPEDYGVLSIFNASTRFLGALIPMGMGHLLLVYLVGKKEDYPFYLKAFIKITLTICLVLTLIIVIAHFFINNFFGLPILLAISLPFIALMVVYFETITSYFIYLKQFEQYAKLTLTKFFIEIALVILLVIIFQFSWEGRITAVIVSLLLIVLYGFYYFTKNKILQFSLKTNNYNKELIKKGFPLIFMGIATMIINLSDRFFIEHFVNLKETGLYGISSTIAGILLMVIGAINNVVRPIIYEKLQDLKTNKKYLITLTIKYVIGLLISSLLLAIVSKGIFLIMINETYYDALPYTYPLIIGLFFWGVYNYFLSFLMYRKDNLSIGIVSVLGIIINIGLNYLLIIRFGTIGAAYATLLTYVFICISTILIMFVSSKRK